MSHDGIEPHSDPDSADDRAVTHAVEAFRQRHPHAASDSWLLPPIMAITRLVVRFSVPVLALAIGLAAACMLLAVAKLAYKSSRLDLLNPKSDYNQLWIEYINEFGDEDDAVIVVEGPGHKQVVPVLVELSDALAKEQRLFHGILNEADLARARARMRAKGLHHVGVVELQAIDRFLNDNLLITNGEWSRLQVARMLTGVAQQMQAAVGGFPGLDAQESLTTLQRLVDGLLAQFGPAPRYQSPWPGMPASLSALSELGSEYLLTKEGRLGFVLLRVAVGRDEFARGSDAVDALRELIAQTEARHSDVTIGLTGLPIMENDEMRASQSSMVWASLISFVGVAVVVVAGFGGVRHALLANVGLLIGMAWSFGYVTLTIGHLNILSVTFTVTLIGIGIDFGTYYVARYMQYRRAGMACDDALLETSHSVGPSIAIGALTTSIAFFAAGLTSFVGVAELGVIAGGGLLLCAVAQLFVLPALVHVVDQSRIGDRIPHPVPVHKWIAPLLRAPRLVIALGLFAVVMSATGIRHVWYDHNLLNMQAQGLESVELERRLLSECEQSVWYALSIADSREELLQRKAEFMKLPSVERTQDIVSLLPDDHETKQPIIAAINSRLEALPERPPLIAVDTLEEVGAALAQAQEFAAGCPDGAVCAQRLELLRDALRRLPAAECYAKLSQFQQQMAGDLLSRLHALRSVSNPQPPQLSDLPPSLVDRFVGQNGKYLLKVYGHGNIWNMQALENFVRDVRTVDPRATGNPLQAYEASLQMKRSYVHAAIYAFLIIIGVLYFDFRNAGHSLLAALPLALGLLITFGLLGYIGQPLNPANLIALPLLLGIGIDYGVHIVHEFLEQKGRYRISPATAVAVLVDALTTIIGFGSLMIAQHQGLQSLGRVLTIGVTACTLTSLVMLPALLAWITRHRPLVPWVADAVESYDHHDDPDPLDESRLVTPRQAA